MPLHTILPDIVTGYELNPGRGWLSVIVPKQSTNLIPNPDFERGIAGWVVPSGLSEFSQVDPVNPASGAYAGRFQNVTPYGIGAQTGSAVGVQTIPTTAGVTYVLSFKYRTRLSSATETLQVRLDGSVNDAVSSSGAYLIDGVPSAVIPQRSNWTRCVFIWREATTQLRAVNIETVNVGVLFSTSGDLWLDEVQMETGLEATTFISGDLAGPAIQSGDYNWLGAPGNSASVRAANCVAGGEVVNFSNLGFRVIAIIGLGMAGYNNIVQKSSIGGGYYSETIVEGTTFRVIGRFEAGGALDLAAQRDALIRSLRHDRAGESRPVVLRWQLTRCDDLMTGFVDIPCAYQSGLEGQVDNLYGENVAITFQHYNRDLIERRQAGTPLSNVEGVSGYDTSLQGSVLYNSVTDTYSYVSLTNVTTIKVARPAGDGTFWIGGAFTDAGGITTADYVAKWNPDSNVIQGFGSGTVSGVGVDGIVVSQTGYVYVFGQFSQLAGVTTNNLVRYDPATAAFVAFGNPNGRVRQVVETPGRIYVFGDFTSIGGVAVTGGGYTTNNGASWNAVAFTIGTVTSALGGAYDPKSNRLYYSAVTSVQSYAGYLNLTTGGSTAFVFAPALTVTYPGVFLHPNGSVYMVRSSLSASYTSGIIRIQGEGSVDIATYPLGYDGGVARTWQSRDGNIHLATVWPTPPANLGGIISVSQYHYFDGVRIYATPIKLGGSTNESMNWVEGFGPYSLFNCASNNRLLIPGLTTIDSVGSSTPARITFQGPGQLSSIENVTTGQKIEFNMTVRTGEVITVDTRTGRVVSSISGPNIGGVLSQSKISRWRLAPGSNRIRLRFWPLMNSGSNEYQMTLLGTGTVGIILFLNASLANTDGGRVYWEVTSGDNGTLRLAYLVGPRVGTTTSTNNITPTSDLAIQLQGRIDAVPGGGPSASAGVVWYPLAHITFDDQLAAIDAAAGR